MRKHLVDFIAYLRNSRMFRSTPNRLPFRPEQLADFLSETGPARVDHQTLRKFIAHLMKLKVSKSSIARKLSAVRSFFKYLNREGPDKQSSAAGEHPTRESDCLPC
jgi:site-specific recombinase XerD